MEFKYLAIKNWDKRQPGRKGKSEWIKDYTDKDWHEDYEKLSFFQRQVLDGCRRLRGRLGKNIPNDPEYIARSLHAVRTDRPHVGHAVSTLIARKLLVLTNQELDISPTEKELDKDIEEEEIKPSAKKRRGPKSPDMVLPVDSRHIRIKSLICNAYEQETRLQCPWGPAEGAQLKRFLNENPSWLDSQIAQCLVNMYASTAFAKGTRPCQFLPRLTQYISGPLNEFNREQSNGSTSRAQDKLNRNRQAIISGLSIQSSCSDARHSVPDVQRNRTDGGAGVVLEGSPQRVKSATNT